MGTGRNDPCACKSGKKFKLCCMAKEKKATPAYKGTEEDVRKLYYTTSFDTEWKKFRIAEEKIAELIKHCIKKKFGNEIVYQAWDEFKLLANFSINRKGHELPFEKWLHFSWIPKQFAKTLAKFCCDEHPELFDPYQQRVIEAIRTSPYSFFIIQDLIRDKRLFLKDINLQNELVVKEGLLTMTANKGDILYCRPVTLDEQTILVGHFPYPVVPNSFLSTIAEWRDTTLSNLQLQTFTPNTLIDQDLEMRKLYFKIIEKTADNSL